VATMKSIVMWRRLLSPVDAPTSEVSWPKLQIIVCLSQY
jgi:hypothetical protein